jgi:signal transduction histidine kinase
MNLTLNALRYTSPGGAILLHARREMDCDGSAYALMQVIDSGVGVPSSDLPHIFERSFRGEVSRRREQNTQEGDARGSISSGSGLGLAIAREIVEMHEGRIFATSPLPQDLAALVRQHMQPSDPMPDSGPLLGTAIICRLPMTRQAMASERTAVGDGVGREQDKALVARMGHT